MEVIRATSPIYHTGIRGRSDILSFEETVASESPSYPDYDSEDAGRDFERGKCMFSHYTPSFQELATSSAAQAHEYDSGRHVEKGVKTEFFGCETVFEKTVTLDEVAWISGDEGCMLGKGACSGL